MIPVKCNSAATRSIQIQLKKYATDLVITPATNRFDVLFSSYELRGFSS